MITARIEMLAHKAWVCAQKSETTPEFKNANLFTYKDVQGFSGEDDDILYIAFQGTADFKDALADITITKKAFPFDIKIHKGFHNQYLMIEPFLYTRSAFFDKIVLSGQSLGGALALISSHFMEERYPTKEIMAIAFAPPKAGNRAFCNHYLVEHKLYQYKDDMVIKLPPSLFGYRHPSKPIRFGTYKWWEKIFFPITKLIGNPFHHAPKNYMDNWKI